MAKRHRAAASGLAEVMAEPRPAGKRSVEDLAILGAPPAFESPLHVGQPNVGDRRRLHRLIDEALDRRWLTNHGPLALRLEAELARFLGVRHCIAICNGTVALELAIRALGLSGEVIVPSFTFVATAHALQWQQITPVFCDVSPDTFNIDPACIERLVTPRTTGILGVHLWGRPCDVEALEAVAREHRLQLLFDAAHAFGAAHRGRRIGSFGRAEVFSFHATKVFNTFEGGAIATDDDELARRIRWMQNFGFSGIDRVDYVGVNGKMSEPCAAMGLVNLDAFPGFVAWNRRNYLRYRERLGGIAGLRLARFDPSEQPNYQYVVAEVLPEAGIERDLLVDVLHAERVLARRYFHPGVHRMEPYRSHYPNAGLLLPHTEALARRTLALPTGTGVSLEAVDAVCDVVEVAIRGAAELRRRSASLRTSPIAGVTPTTAAAALPAAGAGKP